MGQVELVRERWTFDHAAPDARSIVLEYTVRNNGEADLYQLFLPLPTFLANLQVLDEDGSVLNYLPNREVERVLREWKGENPADYERLLMPFADAQYRLSIVLPEDAPLRPGCLRILRLVHTDAARPKYVRWSVLRLPSYHITHARSLLQSHGLHVAVNAPPNTHLALNVEDGEVRGRAHYYATPEDEVDYHFNAHLPPPENRPYRWQANYRLGPTAVEQWVLTAWLLLSTAASLWLLVSAAAPGVYALVPEEMAVLAAGVTGTSAALIWGLESAWAERYRLLLLPSLALAALAWLRWFVVRG